MAPTSENLRNIAEQAERDLNTYEAKTGAHRARDDEAGVDTRAENRFRGAGAEVRYGDDLVDERELLTTSGSRPKRAARRMLVVGTFFFSFLSLNTTPPPLPPSLPHLLYIP